MLMDDLNSSWFKECQNPSFQNIHQWPNVFNESIYQIIIRHIRNSPSLIIDSARKASIIKPVSLNKKSFLIKKNVALTGVAQWIECQPVNRKVASWIPSRGTCLGCRPDPHLGEWERQLIAVSLPFSLLSTLSLKMNIWNPFKNFFKCLGHK